MIKGNYKRTIKDVFYCLKRFTNELGKMNFNTFNYYMNVLEKFFKIKIQFKFQLR